MVLPDEVMGQIDQFCDVLWLEDGLAKNTVEAYRRDMRLFAEWLHAELAKDLYQANHADISAYIASKHTSSKATSANRRLSVLKRFIYSPYAKIWLPSIHVVSSNQLNKAYGCLKP